MEATLDENRSYGRGKAESHTNDVRMPNTNYNKQGDTQQDIAEQHTKESEPRQPSWLLSGEVLYESAKGFENQHGEDAPRERPQEEREADQEPSQ